MSRSEIIKDAGKAKKKFASVMAIIHMLFAFACIAPSEAAKLPEGLVWGMDSEVCGNAMESAGFVRAERGEYAASGDRALRNMALLYGVREVVYRRSGKVYSERARLFMYNESLFRVVVSYDDFAKKAGGVRDAVVGEMSEKFGRAPHHIRGTNSGMDLYRWHDSETDASFVYRELPGLDFYFAEADYRHSETSSKLKKAGLLTD